MAEIQKVNFKGLDTDTELRYMAEGMYRYAKNVRVGSSAAGNVGAVENIKGNTLVAFDLPAGSNKCIGGHEDIASNSVYYFIWNSNDKHGVYKYNGLTSVISKIFPIDEDADDILGFEEDKLITGTGFTNNILFWTDGVRPQRRLNVVDALTYTAPYLEAHIDFVKIPPTIPITCVSSWVNESDVEVVYSTNSLLPNFMSNKSYQFRYRYIFKDNERSVWSVYSKLMPTGYALDFKNKILLTIDNDELDDAVHYSEMISSIEIAFRDGDPLANKLIARIPFPTSDGPVTYDFRNDKAYPFLDTKETSQEFHTVPLKSNALAIAKSRVFLGGNTEGFAVPQDFSCSTPVKAVITDPTLNNMYLLSGSRYSGAIGFYERADRKSGAQEIFSIVTDERHGAFQPNSFSFTLSGQPPIEATHWQLLRTASKNKSFMIQVVVTIVSQTIDTVVFQINNLNSENVVYNFTQGDRCNLVTRNLTGDKLRSAESDINLPQDNLLVVKQEGANITVKWVQGANTGTYALQTGCLVELYSPLSENSVEEYFEIGERYPVINPGEAGRRFGNDNSNTGKNLIIGDGLVDNCGDIHYRDITKPVGALTDAYAFFSFKIENVKATNVLGAVLTYQAVISGPGFSKTYNAGASLDFNETLDPSFVVSQLMLQMQVNPPTNVVITNTGDTITATNSIPGNYPLSVVTSYTNNHPVSSGPPIIDNGSRTPAQAAALNLRSKVEAMASNDDFFENWQKNIGRPNVILLETEREIYKKSAIRYGGIYVQDTQINALCAFYFSDQSVLPVEFGALCKLQVAANNQAEGSVLLSIHANEIVSLYIEQATLTQGAGGQLTANTSDIIGSINPLAKGIGCINPESVKQINGRVYGYDLLRGIVWRYAQNGLDAISEIGMRNFFYQKSQELLPSGTVEIYGGIDPYHNEYILSMPCDDDTKRTVAWNETTNKWTSFYSFIPEHFERINTKFISFQIGALWVHDNDTFNNFYGEQLTSMIQPVCNLEPSKEKILLNVNTESQDVWVATSITTPEGQETNLVEADYVHLANAYSANVLRDVNTPNIDSPKIPVLHGDWMRSSVFLILMENTETELSPLYFANFKVIASERSNK